MPDLPDWLYAGIHAAVLAALTASFLPRWWLVAAVVGGMHYLINSASASSWDPPR